VTGGAAGDGPQLNSRTGEVRPTPDPAIAPYEAPCHEPRRRPDGRGRMSSTMLKGDRENASGRRPLRICLAASGGGHVRQLLDLEPSWAAHEVFFVSEDSGLTRSLRDRWSVEFVDHVALGQGRLGAPIKMLAAAVTNLFQSLAIVLRRRPDVVVTTGAGSVYFTVLAAKLLGARVLVIESLARFEVMSAFARIAGPLADEKVLQSPALSRFWPKAPVFDPIRRLEGQRPAKEPLLLVTVGATLPFDRMVASVLELARGDEIPERIVIQTGVSGLADPAFECHETLPLDDLLGRLRVADIVVCHGGTGSLITALREGCRVVAMPRLFERGEHYDDHQAEITGAFAARGLIEVAHSTEELREALARARAKPPVMATSDPEALRGRLTELLASWSRRS
jgi:UDP-N-acetylglucosamine--N-acetylmuramyl-(pentapeptide) pyrophosphoryl-undecaprenol N-acetylglucosamine transferase